MLALLSENLQYASPKPIPKAAAKDTSTANTIAEPVSFEFPGIGTTNKPGN